MMHLEDRFPFLDARFNGLPVVVGGEPTRQVCGDSVLAEVDQHAVADCLACMETFKRHIGRRSGKAVGGDVYG